MEETGQESRSGGEIVKGKKSASIEERLSQRKRKMSKTFEQFDYRSHNLNIDLEDELTIKDYYYDQLYKILEGYPDMIPDVKYSALLMFSKVLEKFALYHEDLYYTMFACLYLVSKGEQWSLNISKFIAGFHLENVSNIESKLIQQEIKILDLIDFDLNFSNPINCLRGMLIILETTGITLELESLSLSCICFINEVFRCRHIVRTVSMRDIILCSLFASCEKMKEGHDIFEALVEIFDKNLPVESQITAGEFKKNTNAMLKYVEKNSEEKEEKARGLIEQIKKYFLAAHQHKLIECL